MYQHMNVCVCVCMYGLVVINQLRISSGVAVYQAYAGLEQMSML